jgi:GrpB-like predicted nucleotidyltransferase (UPF0157 family)
MALRGNPPTEGLGAALGAECACGRTGARLAVGSVRYAGGLIRVLPYDTTWPEQFAVERDRLVAALAATAVRIEHVGSTAVPGLAAKPWIDIQLEVPRLEQFDAYGPALFALGYQHHPDDGDHEFFDRRPYHVHVCQAGGTWSRRTLAFRDLLRRDPATRLAYEVEKRRLAAMFDDVEQYTQAKTPFIQGVQPPEADWPS